MCRATYAFIQQIHHKLPAFHDVEQIRVDIDQFKHVAYVMPYPRTATYSYSLAIITHDYIMWLCIACVHAPTLNDPLLIMLFAV